MSHIYFISPDLNTPAGGIKQLYRQVDVLNKKGLKAYVVHGHRHFKVNWFKNETPVVWHPIVAKLDKSSNSNFKKKIKTLVKKTFKPEIEYDKSINNKKLVLNPDDIIVFPEFYGKAINTVFQDQKTVVYNQNCYYSFRGYGIPNQANSNTSIYKQDRLQGVIVASVDAVSYVESFLVEKPVYRVRYGIDKNVFSFQANKKKQIAFMPRKLREDSEQILNILDIRGVLDGWNIVSIQGMNEEEVAGVLKESAVFLSFNHREGFGMPPAEAMSCGCIVVGYTGQGGEEYFLPNITYKVPQRNVTKFAETLEQVMLDFDSNPKKMAKVGLEASKFIESEYSMKQEEESIVKVWQELLKLKDR
ncbi:glycosyltransferase [Wocania ichthyoenteri]|uniref:glycosyltransferase n=1 Tax=Wocania ichthyoenteri TaxID=1230531 RepID=UPI00068C8AF9|nr:glycosyltransferase [Wocania ichthyoenteri]